MAAISLDNHLEDFVHSVDGVQLHGFLSTQHVVNFLNIPYANCPVRWKSAQPLELTDIAHPHDATRYGPRCPQPVGDLHLTMGHLFEKMSLVHQLADERACLNLNIYIPPSALRNSTNLPVFVWIHGGGFNSGDNTVQFDGNHLVQRSLELDLPIIIVVINYRLNILGFCYSNDLSNEMKGSDENCPLNLGLHDQRLALQWIQRNIKHFGGDPTKVTVCGESAGAFSILCHLKAGLPLFQQALIQSPPFPVLRTEQEAQAAFDRLTLSAGIDVQASAIEKIAALRAITADQLVAYFDGQFSTPIQDESWFEDFQTYVTNPQEYWARLPTWCDRILIGNTQEETALMFASVTGLDIAQTAGFVNLITTGVKVPPEFSFIQPSKRDLINWSTRESFTMPCMDLISAATVQSSATDLYVYRIDCPDPFPGDLQGYSWHSYGIPFFFNQPACRIFPHLGTMQDVLTTATVQFLHGFQPWEAFSKAQKVLCCTAEGSELLIWDVPRDKTTFQARTLPKQDVVGETSPKATAKVHPVTRSRFCSCLRRLSRLLNVSVNRLQLTHKKKSIDSR